MTRRQPHPIETCIASAVARACIVAAALSSPLAAANASTRDAAAQAWASAGQMIVVTTDAWTADHGTLHAFTRSNDGTWHSEGDGFDVTVGRAGLGWGSGLHPPQSGEPQKAEGDGRAPAGVFAIGTAFGYADTLFTALDYAPMQSTHWCIDVADSPLYNSIVDTREVGDAAIEGSTEPMRRDIHVDGDQRYKQGFVIEHNPQRKAAGGSCIFAHLWTAPGVPTAGCTAMSDAHMTTLMGWLDPAQQPVFVTLPRDEYVRLQDAWALPALPAGAR